MRITINRNEFYDKLELVSKASTKHITLPVLQCVLLETADNGLLIKATNLEIGIEAKVKARVEDSGAIAVPAAVLVQTINLINKEEVTLEIKEGSLIVESGSSKTVIKCIPHEEFPSIPKVEGSGQTINNSLFSLGIKSAAFAASQSSIKPELGSVYIHQKKEHTLTFVATDSFRLMEKTVPQKNVVFDSGILIPQKNAVEISRVCDIASTDPVCRANENQFSLEFDSGVYITSRLVSGSFPDYEQIIPKEYVTHTTLLKEDLALAFKKTNIFLNKFFQVSLKFEQRDVIVSAISGEVGDTTESVNAQTEGDELTLSFNQRYIAESLSHFVDDSVVLHLSGIGRPMVIQGTSDKSVRYLVMPMNK